MRFNLLIIFLIFLSALGCGQKPVTPENTAAASTSANSTAAPKSLEVTTAAALERSLPHSIEVTGNLEGQEEITVSSEVEGNIAEVFFDLGSYVKAGEKLVTLD